MLDCQLQIESPSPPPGRSPLLLMIFQQHYQIRHCKVKGKKDQIKFGTIQSCLHEIKIQRCLHISQTTSIVKFCLLKSK